MRKNRMIDKIDIKERLKSDFGDNTQEATQIILDAISKYEYLNSPRIIRCIIHLSEKSLNRLKQSINQAKEDPRDVMLWAEYVNLKENQEPKRIRDFNKTFQDCEKNVKE